METILLVAVTERSSSCICIVAKGEKKGTVLASQLSP